MKFFEQLFNRQPPNTTIIDTAQGRFQIPTDIEDPISKSLVLIGQHELDLSRETMELVRTITGRPRGEGTIVDIGANNGVISIGMLMTGELERAVMIEPDPGNFQRLMANVKLNKLGKRVRGVNVAAADKPGTVTFELSADNFGDHRVRHADAGDGKPDDHYDEASRDVIEVSCETVDSVVGREHFKDVAVVWMDVQGYEGFAIRGAQELFGTGVPVMSEIWPYGIHRTGMTREAFCAIVRDTWSRYWTHTDEGYVEHPISDFPAYYDSVSDGVNYGNVVFTA